MVLPFPDDLFRQNIIQVILLLAEDARHNLLVSKPVLLLAAPSHFAVVLTMGLIPKKDKWEEVTGANPG